MVTVGVDLGGTNVQVVVLGDDDERRGWSKMRTPPTGDRATVLDVIDAAVSSAIGDAGISMDDVLKVGIGTPGVVIDGTVGGASNVPGWFERFSLREGLSTKLGTSVRVMNDVTAAAVGEAHLGAARGAEQALTVFVGTGVGAGLVLGSRPYEGAFGGAGEFGHMVVRQGGAVCPCGRRGCVEAYAGRRAMVNAAERAVEAGRSTVLFTVRDEKANDRVTASVIRQALDRGDTLVADLLDDAVDALGAGIASAVNLLDVERVVIGGDLADELGEPFLRNVEAAMVPHLFMVPARVSVVAAELGVEAGAIGAAVTARS